MKFLADKTVGRLGRRLRMMGIDCAWTGMADLSETVKICVVQDRILLTRDSRIRELGTLIAWLLLKHEKADELVEDFLAVFPIDPFLSAFTRCIECNAVLEPICPEDLPPDVPLYVRLTQKSFSRCPGCKRVYWDATHTGRMKNRLLRMRHHV